MLVKNEKQEATREKIQHRFKSTVSFRQGLDDARLILQNHLSFSQATAAANNISATPTFLFFRNRVRVDQYQGADAAGLEEKIKQHTENDPGNSEDSDIPKGYVSG